MDELRHNGGRDGFLVSRVMVGDGRGAKRQKVPQKVRAGGSDVRYYFSIDD